MMEVKNEELPQNQSMEKDEQLPLEWLGLEGQAAEEPYIGSNVSGPAGVP